MGSTGSGYGVASVFSPGDAAMSGGGADAETSPADDAASRSTGHTPLTDRLGCSEVAVDAYAIGPRTAVDLDPGAERVVLSYGGGDAVTLDGRFSIPGNGLARLPPSRPCTVGADVDADLLVVSAPTTGTDAAEATILDVDDVEYELPATSDVATAHLTARLGCTGLKANARLLEPGQSVPYHTEGTQEELFVPLEGAAMRIADERVATPRGSVVRVAPDTPRSAINDGDAETRWLMFGAPPTGGPTEWDPGATIVE